MELTDRISSLKGIGPKKAEGFSAAGIETIDDFLHFFPRKYEDRRTVTPEARSFLRERNFFFGHSHIPPVCRKPI